MEHSGVLPTTEFAYQKGLSICVAFLCMSHTLQSALATGQDTRIMQIDFNAAFDKVKHQDIHYKLCSGGIGGSVLSKLTQFLSNRSLHVMVDGCRSKLVNIVSGVKQGSVSEPLFFLLYTSVRFYILENKKISYADESNFMAVVLPKVSGLKEVYSPKLLEPTSSRCQVMVLVIMSHCINFSLLIRNGVK